MADEEKRELKDLGQDPYVERRRPNPSQPPEAVKVHFDDPEAEPYVLNVVSVDEDMLKIGRSRMPYRKTRA
jgi:hypothetical protein